MQIRKLSATGLVPCKVNAKDMHAQCRLLADGAACSEVQKSEKNVMHQLVFSHTACSALLLLLIIFFQYMKLHQMCMLFVLNNIVYNL